jgi:hypothetical protein
VTVGQDLQEGIIRSVLEKEYGVFVELGSDLQSFEQHADHVIASIVKSRKDEDDIVEQAKVSYLVGCDGAHSRLSAPCPNDVAQLIFYTGIVRKKLGLTFLGDTPNVPTMLLGDIHVKGLDNSVGLVSLVQEHKKCLKIRLRCYSACTCGVDLQGNGMCLNLHLLKFI